MSKAWARRREREKGRAGSGARARTNGRQTRARQPRDEMPLAISNFASIIPGPGLNKNARYAGRTKRADSGGARARTH